MVSHLRTVSEAAVMESVGGLLRRNAAGLFISKQRLRRSESIQLVPLKRECRDQELGYSSRPFCAMWASSEASRQRCSATREAKRQVPPAGHGTSVPWSTLGAGSPSSHFPGYLGSPSEITTGEVLQRSRSVGHLRLATGRVAVPAAGSGLRSGYSEPSVRARN